jgi:thiol-disulfide isomerase/thioredoxin
LKYKVVVLLLGGLLVGVGLAAMIFAGSSLAASGAVRSAPVTGSLAPGFQLVSLKGGEVSLDRLRGKLVILNFWATWCPPCKEEMPLLQDYADKHPTDTVLLGINFDEQAHVVQDFVDELNLRFTILLDPGGKISDLYRVRAYPTTFFVGTDGKVRAYHVGLLSKELVDMYYKTAGGTP